MKLKLDENGHVVVEDGKPVYIHTDGSEAPFDAEEAIKKVNLLGEEKTRHWTKAKNLESELEKYKPIEDIEAAIKALDVVANLDAKQLIDAGEVEKLKKTMTETLESEKSKLQELFNEKETGFKTELDQKNSTIFDLMVVSQFAKSPYFTGEKPKTLLPPDMAADYFGKFFKVVGEGAEAKVVGFINGEQIPSKKNLGNPAEFDEAITAIIDAYPMKDRIMRATKGGPGGDGNLGSDQLGDTIKLTKSESLKPEVYRAAKEKSEETGKPLDIVPG